MSFNASVQLSNATAKACGQIATDFSTDVVRALASKYGFSAEEAIRDLGLDEISVKRVTKGKKSSIGTKEPKVERDIPKVILPWTGKALGGDFCHGLRLNHGLHSQCFMAKCGDGIYCKTCQRQADKNSSGKPTYGDIETRAAAGILEFRDPKDNKLTVPYANVMEKLGVSREEAESEASRFGLEIPEEHFVKRVAKRGRPAVARKKVADSDGSDTPKKRGRPKKAKKVIESSVGDDLIAELVAQSKAGKSPDASNTVIDEAIAPMSPKAAVVETNSSEAKKSTEEKEAKKAAKKKATKKAELSEEEKAAKKAAAAEKRKAKAAAKKAEKAEKEQAKKEAELAAMKAKMLAMKAELDEAAAKANVEKPSSPEPEVSEKPSSPEVKESAPASPEIEDVKTPSPVVVENGELTEDVYGAETEDEDEDDEEEVKVVKFDHGGKSYLKSSDNMLYDPASQELVGCWNPATEEIEEVVEYGSDDEDSE